jgi:hypothetical protein
VFESEDYYIINFSIDEFELESVGDYTKIVTNSKGSTSELGMPKLPQFSSLIEIDRQYEYTVQYNVTKSQKARNIKIFPNQAMVDGLEKSTVEDINESYYGSSQLYPDNKVFLSNPMVMRDINISILSLIPFNYNPLIDELEVYEEIEIKLTKSYSGNSIEKRSMPKSRVFENIYKNHILNYNSNSRDEDYQPETILYICGGSSSSNSYFQDLVEWRHKQGYEVNVIPTSESGSSETAINNFISITYKIIYSSLTRSRF